MKKINNFLENESYIGDSYKVILDKTWNNFVIRNERNYESLTVFDIKNVWKIIRKLDNDHYQHRVKILKCKNRWQRRKKEMKSQMKEAKYGNKRNS